jgi:hypothetical protein
MDEDEVEQEEEEVAETGIDSQVRIDSIIPSSPLPSPYVECFVTESRLR